MIGFVNTASYDDKVGMEVAENLFRGIILLSLTIASIRHAYARREKKKFFRYLFLGNTTNHVWMRLCYFQGLCLISSVGKCAFGRHSEYGYNPNIAETVE